MNFVMLLSLLKEDCNGNSVCGSDKNDIAIIMLAMQTQSPGSALDAFSMLPILMMRDSSNNEDLILFMEISRQRNKYICHPTSNDQLVQFLTKTPDQMSPMELNNYLSSH